jgi:ABC-type nickel/cobalt efflux system permease component RcnA
MAMIPCFAFLQSAAPPTDALTRLLHQQQITPWMIVAAIGIAFVLGAAHALTPGHGKTIVAAYLVGSRGTLKHAAFLGAMVTFTHTVSVFLLGLATLFLFQYVVPQKVTQVLGAISGLSIVVIGGWMLFKRLRGAGHAHAYTHDHSHTHDHGHEHHPHEHPHAHPHEHPHAHPHEYSHDQGHEHTHQHAHSHGHSHSHSHGEGGHTHMPEEVSWSGLVALGASGGLVPCESALVLLLTAIALRRVGLGLLLLVSFSLGLALVLMAIGILVIYAKNLLPSGSGGNPFFRWMPVASAAVVMLLGLVMTGVSLGWIRPQWMAG